MINIFIPIIFLIFPKGLYVLIVIQNPFKGRHLWRKIMKKNWICLLVIVGITFAGMFNIAFGAEQEFPVRSIQFICPFEAGSGCFLVMRVLGQAASEILGRPVEVVARPGGSGLIATEYVAKARPDGYTTFIYTSTNIIMLVTRKLRYTNADFEIFCQVFEQPLVMVSYSGAPWNSLEEFIQYAKKHPGELKYGSSGVGSSHHLAWELVKQATDIKVEHLPFLGGPQLYTALVAGHVPVSIYNYGAIQGLIDAGKLKVLAQGGETRDPRLPDIPTFIEKGYPQVSFYSWFAAGGPKGMPKKVSEKLTDAFSRAIQDKSVMEAIKRLGWTPRYRNTEDYAKFAKTEEEKFRKIVRETNIKIE
jgi:tripartite-type tricarboxylate transporter receptor subunit TctC